MKKSFVIPAVILIAVAIIASLIDWLYPGWLQDNELLTLPVIAALAIIGAWAIRSGEETESR